MGVPRELVAAVALALGLAAPAVALAAFPGSDPHESPRLNTPDDPDFDRCESDDPDTADGDCSTYFEEEFNAFGFSPESANQAPNPGGRAGHVVAGTRYTDCSQLDAQGREANAEAYSDFPAGGVHASCLQISGVRADTAWKYSKGLPDVAVAVLDTGIRWQDRELVDKIRLNPAELPRPQTAGGVPCGADDCNGDGAFSVSDYADDPRVAVDAGDDTADDDPTDPGHDADSFLDASDLIATFSDGVDDDGGGAGNGYVDDIAGWDFFDDDNNPFDASSCCSAGGHGTGRAREAVSETNNALNGTGMCPECQLMPIRVWDSFVVPTDLFALGVTYAADNGAAVVEGAVGGLTNTRFARDAFDYADRRGLSLMLVSSDINSANHNYPTNYDEAVYVAGSMPDTAPNDTCEGPGGIPGVGSVPGAGDIPGFQEGCEELLDRLGEEPVEVTPGTAGQPITTSFFRNSNLTQYGGKADIVLMGSTGSQNTGQASGAAALLASFGRQTFGADDPLSGNEIRQLLTMTAEDVLPQNTGSIGLADRANPGWDSHFGYGRVSLAGAMARIVNDRGPASPSEWPCADSADSCVPPEAQLDAPDWFAPINVDRLPARGVEVRGHAAAPHSASGVGSWEVEYACGQDARDSAFASIPGGLEGTGEESGRLGFIPVSLLEDLADNCDGSVPDDPGRPAGTADQAWPADPFPEPDPERHAFQIRLTVREADNPRNVGVYRKTLHAYRDDGNLAGWPLPVGSGSDADTLRTGSGGEASPRLYDVDGDNALDVLLPTSSGELHALNADGTPVASFNGGDPVTTDPYMQAGAARLHPSLPAANESLRVPVIGDIDGDDLAEIVATAGEHIYAWELDGDRVEGFPVRVDPALSDPCVDGAPHPCFDVSERRITPQNHIKRGFMGSPALADLDDDGLLDVVAGSLDQHVYAFDGAGQPLPNFPVKLESDGADGAEIVTSPAIADLDGEGPPEVIIATNEVIPGDPEFPTSIFELPNALLASSTGANPIYAIHGDGSLVDGWPVEVGVAAGDLLPLVLPGHDSAALDIDGDGDDEVTVSAGTSLEPGGSRLVEGDGSTIRTYENATADSPDQGPVLNAADYAAVGDLTGSGDPAVIKGGLSLNGAANLLAVNQNLPFSHLQQAWDPATGNALPGYPRATDDWQLVSQPGVARVAGPGPARQQLVGTGLYQLHAYGPDGTEAPGWPKFTGGWLQTTPAVGDADGDGDLDVTTLTREGWSFLWDTGVDACDDSNQEWWTFHHDEHSSANRSHDARPPGSPEDLAAERDPDTGAVALSWTEPGDDWMCGSAARFRVLWSEDPIEEPDDGAEVHAADASGEPGGAIQHELARGVVGDGPSHAAVLYRDDEGNWGLLRSVEIPPVAEEPPLRCANEILGGPGDDALPGTAAGDRIRGFEGADDLDGGGGEDCLHGGRGRDRVSGGAESDHVVGGKAMDVVAGNGGDDTIGGNQGDDRIQGGGGDDTIRDLSRGRDVVNCGGGEDTAILRDPAKAKRDDRVRNCETVTYR